MNKQTNNIQEYVANSIIDYLKKRDEEFIKLQKVTDDLLRYQRRDEEGIFRYRKCHNCKHILENGYDDYQTCNDCIVPKTYCMECASYFNIGQLYVPDTYKERWLCRTCINTIEKREENVCNLIDKGECTINVDKVTRFVKQKYRRCFTCGHTDENGKGICITCVEKCHKGHELSDELENDFFCDCDCD